MTTLNISMPESMRKYVKAQMTAGGYSSASEYLRALVREDQKRRLTELRKEIATGIEQLQRGEYSEYRSGEMADLARQIKERGRRRLQQAKGIPAMNLVRIDREAERDVDDIWLAIAQDNVAAADRLVESIAERYQKLAEFPGMGQKRDDLAPQLRSFPVGNYLIFYRPIELGIEVVRVLHGARDIPEIFREPTGPGNSAVT